VSGAGLFAEALVLGFFIALPLGPVGLVCVGRTLDGGFLAGFFSGLGAAVADGLYGFIAASGFAATASWLLVLQRPLAGAGGLFLVLLGVRFLRRRSPSPGGRAASGGLAGDFLSAFFLTLTNPLTLLSFAALFSALGAVGEGGFAAFVVAGVFCGSALWWLILSSATALLRGRLPARFFLFLERGAGVALAAFGLWIVVTRFLLA
jgi:putative LysE/RhtB family amino acid efflux pump